MLSTYLFLVSLSTTAIAGSITQYSDRTAFTTAVGSVVIEGFGDSARTPISTGVLNSATNLPGIGITPGFIQPGATYSAPVDDATCSCFNIDSGLGFIGGFLDTYRLGINPRPITITFDGPVRAFAFDTSTLGSGTKNVVINFSSGSPFAADLAIVGHTFFGFESSAQDILSVIVQFNPATFYGAGLDNFTYTEVGDPPNVPEPATFTLAGLAIAFAALRRRQ